MTILLKRLRSQNLWWLRSHDFPSATTGVTHQQDPRRLIQTARRSPLRHQEGGELLVPVAVPFQDLQRDVAAASPQGEGGLYIISRQSVQSFTALVYLYLSHQCFPVFVSDHLHHTDLNADIIHHQVVVSAPPVPTDVGDLQHLRDGIAPLQDDAGLLLRDDAGVLLQGAAGLLLQPTVGEVPPLKEDVAL